VFSQSGVLLACGFGAENGTRIKKIALPEAAANVRAVGAGLLVETASKKLYALGDNANGQLGGTGLGFTAI